jgi:hypothetical protein
MRRYVFLLDHLALDLQLRIHSVERLGRSHRAGNGDGFQENPSLHDYIFPLGRKYD